MGLTVAQKADTLGTFRFVSVRLMETLASWVPTSPELEVKTLFGRHLWNLAQHADQLGHRTAELRVKLHYDRPPLEPYRVALAALADAAASGDRVAAFYDVALPDLSVRLQGYLASTDELLDAPSVDIIRRIVGDIERMRGERDELAAARPDVVAAGDKPVEKIQRAFAECDEFVDHREAVAAAGS